VQSLLIGDLKAIVCGREIKISCRKAMSFGVFSGPEPLPEPVVAPVQPQRGLYNSDF